MQRSRAPKHLFSRWEEIRQRLHPAKRLVLILDFDGTLVPLERRPERVRLSDAMRKILRRFARHRRVKIWILSGRRLADIRCRAKIARVSYAGLHGAEREGRSLVPRPGTVASLAKAKRQIEEMIPGLPGTWMEEKGFSFAVHYRGATAQTARRLRRLVRRVMASHKMRLRLLGGKKVWEVLPAGSPDKGVAVRRLLEKIAGPVVPLYVGDDATDEDAFAALRRGITVRVGRARRTRARYFLRNPREVDIFLQKLESEIG